MNIAKLSFQQMGKILIAFLHSSKYWKHQQNPIVIEKGLQEIDESQPSQEY